MNLPGLNLHDIPWWGWALCAAGTGFLALMCVAFGATSKRGGHGAMTMLAAAFLLATVVCVVNGVVLFLQPY